jgi:hypothetical protein
MTGHATTTSVATTALRWLGDVLLGLAIFVAVMGVLFGIAFLLMLTPIIRWGMWAVLFASPFVMLGLLAALGRSVREDL